MNQDELRRLIARAAREHWTRLDLHSKKLATLSSDIGQLTNLWVLDLRDNRLTTLPAEISQLSALQHLYLSDNDLTALPEEISQLKFLRILDLRQNPNFPLPLEILENIGDPQTIIRAYFDSLPSWRRLG